MVRVREGTGRCSRPTRRTDLAHGHVEALEDLIEVDLGNGHLLLLRECQVPEKDRRVERHRVHILGPNGKDLKAGEVGREARV